MYSPTLVGESSLQRRPEACFRDWSSSGTISIHYTQAPSRLLFRRTFSETKFSISHMSPQTDIPTCRHTNKQTCRVTYGPTYLLACMHAYAIVVSWREAGDTRGIVSVRKHTHTHTCCVSTLSVCRHLHGAAMVDVGCPSGQRCALTPKCRSRKLSGISDACATPEHVLPQVQLRETCGPRELEPAGLEAHDAI